MVDDRRSRSTTSSVPPTRSSPDEGQAHSSGDERDAAAELRDEAAELRDEAAEAGDRQAESREMRAELWGRYAEARDRVDIVSNAPASSDRLGAGRDRLGAAGNRHRAAGDRQASSTDRAVSADERRAALVDELTGAHRRDPGMVELQREIARAKRTQHPFVLAFVDVDGLKATNDVRGHRAGDQLLRRVVNTLRAHLRSYDLIIRYGGDEFLCGLEDLSLAVASERFRLINADLATHGGSSVSVGLAALDSNDTLEDLIDRADAVLLAERRSPVPRPVRR